MLLTTFRGWFKLLAAVTLVAVLAACSNSSSDSPGDGDAANKPSGDSDKILIIGTTAQVVSFDPNGSSDTLGRTVINNFNASLYRAVPNGDPVPDMATAAPVMSDDGLTYTVTLKDGIKFGDGTELTAQMYADQFQRALTLGGEGADTRVTPYVKSVEATDAKTIVFHLKDKFALFPGLLMYQDYSPALPSLFPKDKLVNLPPAPIYGTGPFTVTQYDVSAGRIVFEPNPNYFGDKPAWSQVVIRIFDDPQTMALSLANGEIDVAWKDLTSEQITTLMDTPDVTVGRYASGLMFFIVNHALAPTDDPNVNQAIAAVLDRDDAIDRALGGVNHPALYGPIPPDAFGGSEPFKDKFNPPNVDLATELLAKSGFGPDNPVKLAVGYSTSQYGPAYGDAVKILVDQLNASGLFDAEIKDSEFATYLEGLQGGDSYNLGFLDKSPAFDPDLWTALFVNNGGVGTMLTDPDTNEALFPAAQAVKDQIALAATTIDQNERQAAYEKLGDMWADLGITIPLWEQDRQLAFRSDQVQGDPQFGAPDGLDIGLNDILYFDRVQPAG